MTIPFARLVVREILEDQRLDIGTASIREMSQVVSAIERRLDVRFIRMEFGIPGLPVSPIAVEAEIEALRDRGVGHVYAPFDGIPELKEEASRFVELYFGLDVPPARGLSVEQILAVCRDARIPVAGSRVRYRRLDDLAF